MTSANAVLSTNCVNRNRLTRRLASSTAFVVVVTFPCPVSRIIRLRRSSRLSSMNTVRRNANAVCPTTSSAGLTNDSTCPIQLGPGDSMTIGGGAAGSAVRGFGAKT